MGMPDTRVVLGGAEGMSKGIVMEITDQYDLYDGNKTHYHGSENLCGVRVTIKELNGAWLADIEPTLPETTPDGWNFNTDGKWVGEGMNDMLEWIRETTEFLYTLGILRTLDKEEYDKSDELQRIK